MIENKYVLFHLLFTFWWTTYIDKHQLIGFYQIIQKTAISEETASTPTHHSISTPIKKKAKDKDAKVLYRTTTKVFEGKPCNPTAALWNI